MTQEEIIAKAFEVYPEDIKNIPQDPYPPMEVDFNERKREGYIKALTEMNEPPKIEGWVARDKSGELEFWSVKPERWCGKGTIYENEVEDHWYVPGACFYMNLGYAKMSLDLKWEDEPRKVELLIREV